MRCGLIPGFGNALISVLGPGIQISMFSPHLYVIGQSHQERASVITASGDGRGRPPRPEIDGREVRPHLCTHRSAARVRTCACRRRGGGAIQMGNYRWPRRPGPTAD